MPCSRGGRCCSRWSSLGGVWWFWPVEPRAGEARRSRCCRSTISAATRRPAGSPTGITEDIITDLARFRDLDVIARNSTEVYKGKPADVRQVGQDLNVRYVLEGSIQRQGDQVRVTAQLIDAGTGAHVWSERWDRPAEDVFAVQTEIAEQVANRLGGHRRRSSRPRGAAARKASPRPDAYDLYLLGIEDKQRGPRRASRKAIRLLNRRLAIDPNFARAWMAGLGLLRARGFAGTRHWTELRSASAARRAVELDPWTPRPTPARLRDGQ